MISHINSRILTKLKMFKLNVDKLLATTLRINKRNGHYRNQNQIERLISNRRLVFEDCGKPE